MDEFDFFSLSVFDFFLRNILASEEKKYRENEFVEYTFLKKKYYFPANGIYIKINDFGYTLEKSKMMSSKIIYADIFPLKMPNLNCNKCDLFNFLHDIKNNYLNPKNDN